MAKTMLGLVADVSRSYFRNNSVRIDEIGKVVDEIARALYRANALTAQAESPAMLAADVPLPALGAPGFRQSQPPRPEPAVPIRKSVTHERIFCLECGMPVKTLKRHLAAAHNLSPKQYRTRWQLRPDYPMT